MLILINIPSWDIQCPGKECANITHSLVGLYLAGNVCKVSTQCLPMECVIISNPLTQSTSLFLGFRPVGRVGARGSPCLFGRHRANTIYTCASPTFYFLKAGLPKFYFLPIGLGLFVIVLFL